MTINGRPRPGAARPRPSKPEITLQEVRALLAQPPRPPARYKSVRVIYASAWAAVRPTAAGFETIDVAETRDEARGLARRHPGAIVAFRSLRLVRAVEDF